MAHRLNDFFKMAIDNEENDERLAELTRLQERFDKDQSIENYVALRRFAPRFDVEIDRFAGLDPLFSLETELKKVALSPRLICGVLDGNDMQIDELCLQLLERLIERKQLTAAGQTHLQCRMKSIADSLVDHFIVVMLEALQRYGLEPKPALIVLVRERLGGANTDIYKNHKKSESRKQAIFIGFQLRRSGVSPTIRRVADILGVQPSTVSRWFPNGDFLEQVHSFGDLFVYVQASVSKSR